ncbi:MAG: RNase adapter RapZ [Paracoccaceae bacterium]
MNSQTNSGQEKRYKVILVTGPSGAGRSTTIHALEDLGFETIDNMPLALLPRLLSGPPMTRHLALGVDVRNRDFSAQGLIDVVDIIAHQTPFDGSLVYLDCAEDVLLRRFSETRRRHPLAPDDTPKEGLRRETELLGSLRDRADVLIDTTDLSPHELRGELAGWFGSRSDQQMAVSVQSFSYKRGIPHGLDSVFDCRFLRNPHWDKSLRDLDGRSDRVASYVSADPRLDAFLTRALDLLTLLLPAYREEGKSYFSLGLGCTGGQHRSVFVAETLAKALADKGWQVSIRHRENQRKDSERTA